MTRINLGIEPQELCDSHLLGEYRELPRFWNLRLVSKPPLHFTLNKGHVLWCAQFPRTLAERFADLVAEMQHRGFKPQFLRAPAAARRSTLRAPASELERARPLLQERILAGLPTMRRVVWTGRAIPVWVLFEPEASADGSRP